MKRFLGAFAVGRLQLNLELRWPGTQLMAGPGAEGIFVAAERSELDCCQISRCSGISALLFKRNLSTIPNTILSTINMNCLEANWRASFSVDFARGPSSASVVGLSFN